jgi:hypothetical protein
LSAFAKPISPWVRLISADGFREGAQPILRRSRDRGRRAVVLAAVAADLYMATARRRIDGAPRRIAAGQDIT